MDKIPPRCIQLSPPVCDHECEGCGFYKQEYYRRISLIRGHKMVLIDKLWRLKTGGDHEQSDPDGAAHKRP